MSTSNNLETDIIKNPSRDQHVRNVNDFYIPEHVRLGVTPIPQEYCALDGEVIQDDSELDAQAIDYTVEPTVTKNKIPVVGEFVLMLGNKVVCHGDHAYVLSEAKSILYGEHPNFSNKNINIDDVIILKRIGLKIGVFLDE